MSIDVREDKGNSSLPAGYNLHCEGKGVHQTTTVSNQYYHKGGMPDLLGAISGYNDTSYIHAISSLNSIS